MKTSPLEYAKDLARKHTPKGALRIARESYLQVNKDGDVSEFQNLERSKLANFWNAVFSHSLKIAHPGMTRKDYLLGVVVQQNYPEIGKLEGK